MQIRNRLAGATAWVMGLLVTAIPQFIRICKTGTEAGVLVALAGFGTALALMIEAQGGVLRASRFAVNFALAAISAMFAAALPSIQKVHEIGKLAVVDGHRRLAHIFHAAVTKQNK